MLIVTSLAVVGVVTSLLKIRKSSYQKAFVKKEELQKQSVEEQQIQHHFRVSLAALGVSTTGILLYPRLASLAILPLSYVSVYYLERSYQWWKQKKMPGSILLSSILLVGALLIGKYWVASVAFCIELLAQKLLFKTQRHSQRTLIDVFGSLPRFVWIEKNGVEIEVAIEDLQVNDILVVQAGEAIVADGDIVAGCGSVNQQLLTGEAQPVEKETSDSVFASTMLMTGRLLIRVNKTGTATLSGKIAEVLNHAADLKTHLQSQAERTVEQGARASLGLAALSYPVLGVNSALALLCSGFGYQMRIAGPISVLNFLQTATHNGILIKDGRALETLSKVDTVVFDKTGTLTYEQPQLRTIYTCADYDADTLLAYAAAAEFKQTHPVARTICTQAKHLKLPAIDDASYTVGYGIQVTSRETLSKLIQVGSERFMHSLEIAFPTIASTWQEHAYQQGHSLIYVAIDKQLIGAIELQAGIRAESQMLIQDLNKRQIDTYIVSGDHERATQSLSEHLGIDHYFAETLPAEKAELVEKLKQAGKTVCFIGDGINDTLAMQKADVAISMAGAATIATDTAEIVMLEGHLVQLPFLLNLAMQLKHNLNNGLRISHASGMLCIGGVLFFNVGLQSAWLLYGGSIIASVGNAMLPLLSTRKKAV